MRYLRQGNSCEHRRRHRTSHHTRREADAHHVPRCPLPYRVPTDKPRHEECRAPGHRPYLFADHATRAQVLRAPNPGAAKALGRQVRGFDEEVWVQHRYAIVCRVNAAKFALNHDLGRFLRQTGTRVLVEASPVDRIWGIGLAQDDEKATNPNLWKGLNLLGFALMHVRSSLDAKPFARRLPEHRLKNGTTR